MQRCSCALALIGLLCSVAADAQTAADRELLSPRDALVAPGVAPEHFRYGPTSDQVIALQPSDRHKVNAPILVVIGPASWPSNADLPELGWLTYFLNTRGVAVAFVERRSSKYHGLDAAVSDVALAVGELQRQAERRHLDASRIVLAGSGSGALPAMLLATQDRWWSGTGVDRSVVKGLLLLDPDGQDGKTAAEARDGMGTGRLVQLLGGPAVPLLVLQPTHSAARLQSGRDLATAAAAAGGRADIVLVPSPVANHANSAPGSPLYPANPQLAAFLHDTLRMTIAP